MNKHKLKNSKRKKAERSKNSKVIYMDGGGIITIVHHDDSLSSEIHIQRGFRETKAERKQRMQLRRGGFHEENKPKSRHGRKKEKRDWQKQK